VEEERGRRRRGREEGERKESEKGQLRDKALHLVLLPSFPAPSLATKLSYSQEVILVEKTVSPQTLFLLPKLVPVKDCPDLR